jgi:alkylation response protein AidB-like acyl-CoA dehydrogenase
MAGAPAVRHDARGDDASRRESFGKKLGEHQGVGFMLADNEMDLLTTRLAIWHCARVLDQGERGNFESSMAKVISSEGIWRVVDRCVQVLGGQGVTSEAIVDRIFRDARSFRIYDGPNEVHCMSLARKILARAGEGSPQ